MKELDMSLWPRKEIFEFFSRTERPFYSVSFRMDIAPAYRFAKAKNLSFYYSMIWLVTEAINRVEAFRYTIHDGKVCLLPRREPSFTDMLPGAEYFHICTMNAGGSIKDFCCEAMLRSKNQQDFICYTDEQPNLIYISCVPWLDLTGVTNEGELHKDDCIPRITWGKYVPEGEKLMMGFSLEVNHRFIDGADLGRFAEELEKLMAQLDY